MLDVPFQEDCASSYKNYHVFHEVLKQNKLYQILTWPDSCEHKVSDFHDTLRARSANPEHRLWVILVLEGGAPARKHCPSLSDHLSSSRDSNGRSNNIDTSIEKDDFTSRILEIRSIVLGYLLWKGGPRDERTLAKMAFRAAVSSVTPSPFASLSFTLTN